MPILVEDMNEISDFPKEGTDVILLLVVIQISLHYLFKKQKLIFALSGRGTLVIIS